VCPIVGKNVEILLTNGFLVFGFSAWFRSFPLFALMQKVEQKDQGHSTAPHEWPASARQQSLSFGLDLR
jgi:hypothetical protein